MSDFFGFGGYTRPIEGYLSWQHLVMVSTFMVAAIALGVVLGLLFRKKEYVQRNKVLIGAAIAMDSVELFKIILMAIRAGSIANLLCTLPLYMCSIQLIVIPIAAFSHGRLKEAALDFVFIFGILGAAAGTFGSAYNFNHRPCFCFDNLVSMTTHWIAGFSSIYIGFSNMQSMKKKNIWIVCAILMVFFFAALFVDYVIPVPASAGYEKSIPFFNYMYLRLPEGTPYKMFCYPSPENPNPFLYLLVVLGLFALYLAVFYGGYYLIYWLITKKNPLKEE